MGEEPRTVDSLDRLIEGSGLRQIVKTLRLAVHPAKLSLALLGIVSTLVWGGVLDFFSTQMDRGVAPDAIERFIAGELPTSPDDASGEPAADNRVGVFSVWRAHQTDAIRGLLLSSIPGKSVVAGTSIEPAVTPSRLAASPFAYLGRIGRGITWMAQDHFLYFVLFSVGFVLIWSLAGGAICRLSAVQFAHDESITLKESLRFARRNLGGLALGPCIPLAFIALTMFFMFLGGLVLKIPFIGDLVAGLAFPLAIFGGLVIALLMLGLFVGGPLFWPAVAVEGADAFDAFQRAVSYALTKLWKTFVYAALAIIFAGICWVVANFVTLKALGFTKSVVGFGTAPFGWGATEGVGSKLDKIWTPVDPSLTFTWPDWQGLTTYETISGFLIGVYVLLVIGLLWSFLASFFFSGSTIIYFLLRRDVDGIDLDEIHEQEAEPEVDPARPGSARSGGGEALTAPATQPAPTEPPPAPPPAEPPPPPPATGPVSVSSEPDEVDSVAEESAPSVSDSLGVGNVSLPDAPTSSLDPPSSVDESTVSSEPEADSTDRSETDASGDGSEPKDSDGSDH